MVGFRMYALIGWAIQAAIISVKASDGRTKATNASCSHAASNFIRRRMEDTVQLYPQPKAHLFHLHFAIPGIQSRTKRPFFPPTCYYAAPAQSNTATASPRLCPCGSAQHPAAPTAM